MEEFVVTRLRHENSLVRSQKREQSIGRRGTLPQVLTTAVAEGDSTTS